MSLEPVAQALCREHNFEFVRHIDTGGAKEVYLIKSSDQRSFALKIIKRDSARVDREVNAITQCSHRCIGKIIANGSYEYNREDYKFIIEDFLDGGTLQEKLSIRLFTPRETFEFGKNMIEVLAELESHNFVHRDIKPQNIMYKSGSDIPILVDFGIVRDLNQSTLTAMDGPHGPCTFLYASPEQLINNIRVINWRTDQFSLGIVLCYCLFGDHPFRSPGDDNEDLRIKVTEKGPPDEERVELLHSMKFTPICRMINPQPFQRFRFPKDLIEEWKKLEDII